VIDTQAAGDAIERAEIRGHRECVASASRIAPGLDAAILDIAGGVAAFAGAFSPLSEASGLGLFCEVRRDDVERLTQFYLTRETPPRIVVSPLASEALTRELARAGYRPVETQNLLACEIDAVDCRRDARVSESSDARAWGRISAAGFLEREPTPDEALVGCIIASIPSVTSLEARSGGAIVATAAMALEGEFAALFAASTLPGARRSGLQAALIGDRVARARERGARYAHAGAAVGGPSEKNFRRNGFQVLYTRTVWERSLGYDSSRIEAVAKRHVLGTSPGYAGVHTQRGHTV
jgi:GNAT superfamily N-acetyltransferase